MDALNRLETLAMMNSIELPLHALRAQIASAIDVIVLLTRMNDGRRLLTEVAEVLPADEDRRYRIRQMFKFQIVNNSGELIWTGEKSSFTQEPKFKILENQIKLTKDIFSEPD